MPEYKYADLYLVDQVLRKEFLAVDCVLPDLCQLFKNLCMSFRALAGDQDARDARKLYYDRLTATINLINKHKRRLQFGKVFQSINGPRTVKWCLKYIADYAKSLFDLKAGADLLTVFEFESDAFAFRKKDGDLSMVYDQYARG